MMKKILALCAAVLCLNCSAAAKHVETVAVSDAQIACQLAIALNVPSQELQAVCAGVEGLAPVVKTIINARQDPAAAHAAYAKASGH